MTDHEQLDLFFDRRRASMVEDIRALVRVDSVKGEACPGAPFGSGPAAALDAALALARREGFAARNVDGRVILYGDILTESMEKAMNETNRRRALQQAYNELHGITPKSVQSTVQALLRITDDMKAGAPESMSEEELQALMQSVEDQMLSAAKALDFEKAAKLRDQLFELKGESGKEQQIQKPQTRRRWKKRI